MMGMYSSEEFLDTFGGLPEPGETFAADIDTARDMARGETAGGDLLLVEELAEVVPGQVCELYQRRDGSFLWISTVPVERWGEETIAFVCDSHGVRLEQDEVLTIRAADSRRLALITLGGVRRA